MKNLLYLSKNIQRFIYILLIFPSLTYSADLYTATGGGCLGSPTWTGTTATVCAQVEAFVAQSYSACGWGTRSSQDVLVDFSTPGVCKNSAGGTYNLTPVAPPSCASGQVLNSENICVPQCTSTTNPFNSNCAYPDTAPLKDCPNGDVIPASQPCETSLWDSYFQPFGTDRNCSDGSTASAGQFCGTRFPPGHPQCQASSGNDYLYNTPADGCYVSKGFFFGTGSLPSAFGPSAIPFATSRLSYRSDNPSYSPFNKGWTFEKEIPGRFNSAGDQVTTKIEVDIPPPSFGRAFKDVMKTDSEVSTEFQTKAATNGRSFTKDSAGEWQYKPTPTSAPTTMSPNQFDQAVRNLPTELSPQTMQKIADKINETEVQTIPWLNIGSPNLNSEFQRMFAPTPFQPAYPTPVSPTNFPQLQTRLYPPGTPMEVMQPVARFNPSSPLFYPNPAPQITTSNPYAYNPSTPSSTIPNTNITPQTSGGGTVSTPPSTTTQSGDVTPTMPTVQDDRPPLIPWLNTTNPFAYDVTPFITFIPTSSGQCSYEIHKTFSVHVISTIKTYNFDFAPCQPLEPLRQVLKWAFAVITAIGCYFLMFKVSSL